LVSSSEGKVRITIEVRAEFLFHGCKCGD
jgi:hypothetical protein